MQRKGKKKIIVEEEEEEEVEEEEEEQTRSKKSRKSEISFCNGLQLPRLSQVFIELTSSINKSSTYFSAAKKIANRSFFIFEKKKKSKKSKSFFFSFFHSVPKKEDLNSSDEKFIEELFNLIKANLSKIPIDPHFFPFPELFQPIPKPTNIDDWLAQYEEDFDEFLTWKKMFQKRFSSKKIQKIMCLQPIEMSDDLINKMNTCIKSAEEYEFLIEKIKDFIEAFYFGYSVRILPKLKFVVVDKENWKISLETNSGEKIALKTRKCHPYDEEKVVGNEIQVAVDQLLNFLPKVIPEDAACVCSLTCVDLFEGSKDSFVSGYAAGGSRVGVFSIARYDPLFRSEKKSSTKKKKTSNTSKSNNKNNNDNNNNNNDNNNNETNKKDKLTKLNQDQVVLLQRACKIAVHEISHMLGIGHCTVTSCIFNGSGHLAEDFAQPIHCCPIDLIKVQFATDCQDLNKRDRALLDFFEEHGMEEEIQWMKKRKQLIDSEKNRD